MPEHLNSGVGSGRGQLTEQTVDWPSCYCGQVLRVSAYPPPPALSLRSYCLLLFLPFCFMWVMRGSFLLQFPCL